VLGSHPDFPKNLGPEQHQRLASTYAELIRRLADGGPKRIFSVVNVVHGRVPTA
jgi:hypothetical protein